MISISYTLSSKLPALVAQAEVRAALAVEKTARDIEAGSKARTKRVDTGAMKSGWSAEQLGRTEWVVYNPVEYTIYHEFGTVYMSAMPMLAPSVEEARAPFLDAMAQLYGGAG